MSLWTFLGRLWQSVKHLFDGLEAEVKKALPVVIDVVNNVKLFVDSNIPDVIAAVVPGDADDKLLAKIRSVLPGIIIELEADNAIAQLPTVDAQVRAIIAKIQASNPTKRATFWSNLAGLITERIVDDGKFSWSDGVLVAKYIYENKLNDLPNPSPVQSIPPNEEDNNNE